MGLVGGVVYWTGAAWVQNQSDLPKWMGSNSVIVTGTIIQPVRRIPDRQVMVTAVSSVTKGTLQLPGLWQHSPYLAQSRFLCFSRKSH